MLDPVEQLRSLFPNLGNFQITSEDTLDYNCIGWAVEGDTERWWSPLFGEEYYWPIEKPPFVSVQAVLSCLLSQGFEECAEGEAEEGYENIAIFAKAGEPTHVARQLETGQWTSKLGDLHDITHNSLNELRGDEYGEVVAFMRRQVQNTEA